MLFIWFRTNIQWRKVKIYITCARFTNLSRMTNLIITSSFVVGLLSSALFLFSCVSINGWNGNFSFKSEKLLLKEKNNYDYFSRFYVCRPIILTINKFFLEFHWLFQKFKEIITNVVYFVNLFWKFLLTQKRVSLNANIFKE